jgi:outer membrane protein assembly factor BamB
VTEAVIDLDPSSPWEPPAPRVRRARWVAVAAVLAVTLGMLGAGGRRPGADLLYTVDSQVLQALTAGGRLYLARYQDSAPGPMIEARRLSDGRLLWEHPGEVDQQLVTAGDGVVVLLGEARPDGRVSTALTVLDAATGTELWSRSRVTYNGTAAGVVIVEEERDGPGQVTVVADRSPDVNLFDGLADQRFLGLSDRTGSAAWDITVPAGTAVSFNRTNDAAGRLVRLTRFDVLDTAGQLTRRDTTTGKVIETSQLDRSGTVSAMYGRWINGTADQVVVYPPDGHSDPMVFDTRTGRPLFPWPVEPGPALFRCTQTLFCATTEDGMQAVDSVTGERRWYLAGRDTVIASIDERLVVGSYREGSTVEPEDIAVVDSRTGALVRDLPGWRVLAGGSERPLVWRAVDGRAAVLGELDPRTGLIAVDVRPDDWSGSPACSVDANALACVAVGGRLSVWRLPSRH